MEMQRLTISKPQRKILVEFYEKGMVSTKKELSDLHASCAEAVGLSETQVKNWISNYKGTRHPAGMLRKRNAVKSVLIRQRSGYNLFSKEQLSEGDSTQRKEKFSQLGSLWNQLSCDEKEEYNGKASEMNAVSTINLTDPQRCNKIITNMMKEVSELDKLEGVECLVICVNNGFIYHGVTKLANNFLATNTELLTGFARNIQNASISQQYCKEEITNKIIQDIFNEKYSTLIGKPASLPYSKVNDIGLEFVGLPSDVLDIVGRFPKKSNFYSSMKRRKLWECRSEFSFTFNPPCLASLDSTTTETTTTSLPPLHLTSSSTSDFPTISAITTTNSAHRVSLPPPSSSDTISTTPMHSSCSSNTLLTNVETSTTPPIDTTNRLDTSSSFSNSSTVLSVSSLSRTTSSLTALPITLSGTTPTSSSSHPNVTSENSCSEASILLKLPVQSGALKSQKKLFLQLKEGTRFGLMDNTNTIRGSGKLRASNTLHGRQIPTGSLVVEIDTLEDNCSMKPPISGPFDEDEPVQKGGFYAWPISKLSQLPT